MKIERARSTRQRAAVFLFALVAAWASGIHAQQSAPPPAAADPDLLAGPAAIAAADISDESINTHALIRAARAEVGSRKDVERIKAEFENYRSILTALRTQTREQLARDGAAPLIQASRREWLHVQVRLDSWLRSLTALVNTIDTYLQRIGEEKVQWQKTRDEIEQDLPPELVSAASDALAAIEAAQTELRAQRSELLSLQARVGQAKAETVQILEDQKREIAERRRGALRIDGLPLWQTWDESKDPATSLIAGRWTWNIGTHPLDKFLQHIAPRLVVQVFVFLFLALLLSALRRKMRKSQSANQSERRTYGPFEYPVSVAAVVCLTAIIVAFPGAPPLWNGLVVTLLVVAGLRVMREVLDTEQLIWAYLLGGVIAGWQVLQALPVSTLSYRLTMLLLSALGFLGTLMITRNSLSEESSTGASARLVRNVSKVAPVFFAIALVADIIGSLSLASILVSGTLLAILSGALVSLAVVMLQELSDFIIQSRFAGQLGVIRKSPEPVRQSLYSTFRVLGWVIWIYVVLRGFLVLDPVYEGAVKALKAKLDVGTLSFSLADVLIFILVVWITFRLSRFLQLVLSADILPRLQLPRGVPDAVTALTHYVVVLVGFLIALAAAGFDLSRITILLGALGVGIGFGLQNVVSNFVSGLILLFERPIRQGDVVEIDGTMAVVKAIAMRASVIRDFNGANIIVPNSDLISAKVVNWTYRSDLRRVEIAVGVRYGSNPKEVIELLTRVASANPGVSGRPAPEALFMDFGDSSLDFLLRAWTSVEEYVRISSDLRVEIAEAFQSAGIEIPFPQRDVHLVSTGDKRKPKDPAPAEEPAG